MIQNFFFLAFVLLISVSMSSLLHLDANDIDLLKTQYNSNTIFGDDDLNDETVIAKRQGMIPGPRVGRSGMLPGPRVGRSKDSDIFPTPIAYSYRMYNELLSPSRISRSSMIPPPRVGRGITLPGPRVDRSGMIPPPRVGRGGGANLIPGPRIGRGGMIPNARVGRSSASAPSNIDDDFRPKGMMFVMPEHMTESESSNNGILHDDDRTPRHSVSDASIETQQQSAKYHGRSKRSVSPSIIATDDEDDNGAWNDDYTSSGVINHQHLAHSMAMMIPWIVLIL
ncbi:uncharacterized protein LOC141855779 [Brevipalpus obovatus]|uniref:uncharacterized protein LOC141855779 n=1 Tax=Brevipalpus obovatus TaxID=246614 RepID=UPI003D9F32A4